MNNNIWELLIAGGVGAGILKIIESIIVHGMKRKDDADGQKRLTLAEMQSKIQVHEKRLEADFNHLKLIDGRLAQSDLADQAMLKALHALLSHSVTGNATGEMETARKELVNFIIENK